MSDLGRAQGASGELLAAAFCMFNRYVDGLTSGAPVDPGAFAHRAATIARAGYSPEE